MTVPAPSPRPYETTAEKRDRLTVLATGDHFLTTNKGQRIFVDADVYAWASQHTWRVRTDSGVVFRQVRTEPKHGRHWTEERLAKRVLDVPGATLIRYLDGDKSNCRRANLQAVTGGRDVRPTAPPDEAEARTLPETPERELVERAQAGDPEAFDALHRRHAAAVENYCYRFMDGSPEDADDLAQDAFLKAWLALTSPNNNAHYDPDLRFGAWMYRIANNVCLDTVRHRRLVKWQPWEHFVAAFHPAQVAPDSPERDALQGELAAEVRAVLDALPAALSVLPNTHPGSGERYREVLLLREYGDLSYAEIARAMTTTQTAVKSILYRARAAFKEVWERRYDRPFAAEGASA